MNHASPEEIAGISRRQVIATGALVAAGGLAPLPAGAAPAKQPDESSTKHGEGQAPRGEWLAGDTHVHDDHSSDGSLPRQTSGQRLPGNLSVADQIGQAERMGLDFLPLTDHRTYDQHWDPQWRSEKLLLIPGEEVNGSPHAIVLGAVDTVVDGANPPGSAAYRHVQQSIWDAHAQNAVWSTAHPDNGEYTPAAGVNDNASAQAVDVVEIWNPASDPDAQLDYAENRWNRGFRFGAVAASDCHFRELWGTAGPGEATTWVFAAERTQRAVLDALRAARTTVSYKPTGLFVTLEADLDGDGIFELIGGDEAVLRTATLPRRAALRVRVRGGVGTRVLVHAAPGRAVAPLAEFKPTSADATYVVPVGKLAGTHSWWRVEVRAPGDVSGRDADPTLPDQLRAATSPVFVSVGTAATAAPELALPAASTGEDHSERVLGEIGEFTGFADVSVQDGVTHVVAESHQDGSVGVLYRRQNAHGRRETVLQLSDRSHVARAPRVVASGKDVWVVWQDEDGEQPHRPDIVLRHSGNGGHTFAPPVRLSTGSGRAVHPAICVADRRPVVAWADNTAGAFDVLVQVVGVDRHPVNISAPGKATSAGTPDDARSPRYPASLFPTLTVSRDRRLVVAWQDNRYDADPLWTGHTPPAGQAPTGNSDPDNWQILSSARDLGADAWTPPARIAVTTMADRHPSIAADREGTLVAIWETKTLQSSGANLSLRASRSSDGLTWSVPEPVASAPAAMSQRPRLGRDRDGSIRAVWYDSRSADWRWKVFTATAGRTGWSAPVQLSTAGNNTWPAVDQGVVAFTTDRAAERDQRDRTQQVHLVTIPRS
ncbi:CehA/McbA family metallohydrolase [Kribbella sp. CA-253562]|uniref:CehA/McbA family metallohydrolase n=1 Tax=Kribbella sp. CA-253562 TaxID=3239942 RepID=UPI003D8CC249